MDSNNLQWIEISEIVFTFLERFIPKSVPRCFWYYRYVQQVGSTGSVDCWFLINMIYRLILTDRQTSTMENRVNATMEKFGKFHPFNSHK